MIKLSPEQQDALREISNIGVSQAARQLSVLLDDEVEITVPEVMIQKLSESSDWLSMLNNNDLSCVFQNIQGDYPGKAGLLFHSNQSKSLVKSLVGTIDESSGIDMRDYEHEAIIEVGNIMISSCLSAMANFLKVEFELSTPVYSYSNPLSVLAINEDKTDDEEYILIINTILTAAKREVNGSLLITYTVTSIEKLFNQIDHVLSHYRGDSA